METPMSPPQRPEPGISEQAARWITLLEHGGQTERRDFASWLRASPQHVREFLLLTAMDKELDELDLQAFDVDGLLARAGNVVALRQTRPALADESSGPVPATPGKRATHWWPLHAGIAAAVLLAAAGLWMTAGPGSWQGHVTAVGEQRTFELEDGSIIELRPLSRVDVRLSRHSRSVRLRSGEALFKVERDPARPFRVDTGATVIEVLGTQFTVNRRSDSVTVSVLEGRVAVDKRILEAGKEVKIAAAGAVSERSVEPEVLASRLSRRSLTFSGNTLGEIAEDFNRYNRSPQIRIESESLRMQEFSGVFDAHDPASLVSYLERDRRIEVERRDGALVIRER